MQKYVEISCSGNNSTYFLFLKQRHLRWKCEQICATDFRIKVLSNNVRKLSRNVSNFVILIFANSLQ